jgi:hypothetical protein
MSRSEVANQTAMLGVYPKRWNLGVLPDIQSDSAFYSTLFIFKFITCFKESRHLGRMCETTMHILDRSWINPKEKVRSVGIKKKAIPISAKAAAANARPHALNFHARQLHEPRRTV